MTPLRHKKIALPSLDCKTPPETLSSFSEGLLADAGKDLYEHLQKYRLVEWRTLVAEFEAAPDDVYNAWRYINYHPMFYRFKAWRGDVPLAHERHLDNESGWTFVHIDPHKVDPETRRIEDDKVRNTRLEWWIEFGPTLYRSDGGYGAPGHDHTLDCGADTYEDAIRLAARQIHKHYGNDRRRVMTQWKDTKVPCARVEGG